MRRVPYFAFLLFLVLCIDVRGTTENECAKEFTFRQRIFAAAFEAFTTIPNSPAALTFFIGAEFLNELDSRPIAEIANEISLWEPEASEVSRFIVAMNQSHSTFNIQAFHRSGDFQTARDREISTKRIERLVATSIYYPLNFAFFISSIAYRGEPKEKDLLPIQNMDQAHTSAQGVRTIYQAMGRNDKWSFKTLSQIREDVVAVRDFMRHDEGFRQLMLSYQGSFQRGPATVKESFDGLLEHILQHFDDSDSPFVKAAIRGTWFYPPMVEKWLERQKLVAETAD